MKKISLNGKDYWEGETQEEKAAVRWVRNNDPIIAGSESYGMAAFEAGIEWARLTFREREADTSAS